MFAEWPLRNVRIHQKTTAFEKKIRRPAIFIVKYRLIAFAINIILLNFLGE